MLSRVGLASAQPWHTLGAASHPGPVLQVIAPLFNTYTPLSDGPLK